MHTGEFLTRATIWLGLSLALIVAIQRLTNHVSLFTRWLWAIAAFATLLHVLFAFGTFHGWSHADAYADTARQTADVTGWNWGGGIWFNYLFVALWAGDAVCWLRTQESDSQRNRSLRRCWDGFFVLMAFNATVVFGHGWIRWVGAASFIVLGGLWLRSRAVCERR